MQGIYFNILQAISEVYKLDLPSAALRTAVKKVLISKFID